MPAPSSPNSPSKCAEKYSAHLLQTLPPQAISDLLEAFRSDWTNPATDARGPEWWRCSQDIVYWLETYGKTYDPRLPDPLIPFKPFPRQAEFLRWLVEREQSQEDGLAEKSRDVGFTWLCCAYALHGWLFRPGFAVGFGSRKLELVDKLGDPDCIFEKIRILLRNLPEWMAPRGFKWSEHDNFARLINPETGATITGEGGDNIGRGGRKSVYFIDEAAFLERAQRVEAALSQTTRCRIWVSTPNGPGNLFFRKRHGGSVKVFTFHWRDDPRKDEAWYRRECERIDDPVVIAQEIDIDYTASIEGICIPAAWVRAAVELDLPRSGPRVGGLDVADEGKCKNVLTVVEGPVVEVPVSWGGMNTTQTAWKARDEGERLGITLLNYDAIGVGAGVKGALNSAEKQPAFTTQAINVGEPPTDRRWKDGKTSKERFKNLRAELWWSLRVRFEKAHEYRLWLEGQDGGREHPAEEMISIPNCPELIADLSMPLVFQTDTGKIQLESKPDMAKRGVKSPDYGDSLALAYMPRRASQAPVFGTLKRS